MTLKPAPKLAWLLAMLATLPALALVSYGPPIGIVIVLIVMSMAMVAPAIRGLCQPGLSLVISGQQLLAQTRSGHLKWRARTPMVRAVVTPWALSLWSPWRQGITIFRCQLDDGDYRCLARWLHR